MRKILGFHYQSANNALYAAASHYVRKLQQKGFAAEVFDLAEPGAFAKLDRVLNRDEIAFCFAPQGVGSRLGNEEQTIWKRRQIPFVGVHLDNPCYNIFNHFSDSRYVANLYLYESFADIHRRYIGTDQVVETAPFQTDPNVPMSAPFGDRQIKLLFMKSGESIEECATALNALPPTLRDGVWQQLEIAKRSPNLFVCDLVQELFDKLNISRSEKFDLFWGCAHWMDMYLRRIRALDMVEWLKGQEGAVIIGSGWDGVDKVKARAIFKSSIDISEIYAVYHQTQFMCNTSPYGSDIIHERTVFGLMNECITISDSNAWWSKHFGDIPALKLYDWGLPLSDQLEPVINIDLAQAETITGTGRQRALEYFTMQDQVGPILDCVAQIDPDCLPIAA